METAHSTEAYDQSCDICPESEVEAVGYCQQCRQWLCLKCCQHHEKMSATKFHPHIGRADAKSVGVRTPLIDRMCTPFAHRSLTGPRRLYCDGRSYRIKGPIGDTIVQCAYNSLTNHIAVARMLDNHLCVFSVTGVRVIAEDIGTSSTVIFDSSKKGVVLFVNIPLYSDEASIMKKLDYSDQKGGCKPVQVMEISGICRDLKEFDNGYAASIYLKSGYLLSDWQVQFLQPNGHVKKQICYDKDRKPLFQDAKSVTAINTAGTVVFKVKHGLPSANGLTVDNDDNIYISSPNAVARVDSGGKTSTVILEAAEGSTISNICFNLHKEQLVVFDKNGMKCFSFLP